MKERIRRQSLHHRVMHRTMAVGAAMLALFLVAAAWELPTEPSGLTRLVAQNLNASGVEHPVTAVLLNFRAYDTWLEIGVLWIAVMGVLLFQRRNDLLDIQCMPAPSPILVWFIKLLFPMLTLVTGYLVWTGKYTSGGAFQAGVVLGAGGILLWLVGHRSVTGLPGPLLRGLLIVGFLSFLLVAFLNVAFQQQVLNFPSRFAGEIILLIEAAATISIAVTVAAVILGVQPVRHEPDRPEAEGG